MHELWRLHHGLARRERRASRDGRQRGRVHVESQRPRRPWNGVRSAGETDAAGAACMGRRRARAQRVASSLLDPSLRNEYD